LYILKGALKKIQQIQKDATDITCSMNGKMRNMYKILKPEGRQPFGRPMSNGITLLIWILEKIVWRT
jgi:hypothetical protein